MRLIALPTAATGALLRCLAIAMLLCSSNAFGQPYALVGLTFANIKTETAAEGTSQSFLLGAGYRFTKHIGAEVALVDFRAVSGVTQQGNLRTSQRWKAKGYSVLGVGDFPLSSSLSVLGRLGFSNLDAELESRTSDITTADPGQFVITKSDLGWLLTYGTGLQLALSPNMQVRLVLDVVKGKHDLERIRTIGWTAVFSF